MPAAPRQEQRRGQLHAWLVTAAIGVLIVAVVALTGGFRRGAAFLGSPAAVGEQISTTAWDFAVQDAIVTGTPGAERIAVRLLIRSKLTESHLGITQQALIVRLPDGQLMNYSVCGNAEAAEGQGSFDPFVLSDAVCFFDPLYHAVTFQFTGDTQIEVVMLDQAEPAYDFERTGELEATVPVAHVALVAHWVVQ